MNRSVALVRSAPPTLARAVLAVVLGGCLIANPEAMKAASKDPEALEWELYDNFNRGRRLSNSRWKVVKNYRTRDVRVIIKGKRLAIVHKAGTPGDLRVWVKMRRSPHKIRGVRAKVSLSKGCSAIGARIGYYAGRMLGSSDNLWSQIMLYRAYFEPSDQHAEIDFGVARERKSETIRGWLYSARFGLNRIKERAYHLESTWNRDVIAYSARGPGLTLDSRRGSASATYNLVKRARTLNRWQAFVSVGSRLYDLAEHRLTEDCTVFFDDVWVGRKVQRRVRGRPH